MNKEAVWKECPGTKKKPCDHSCPSHCRIKYSPWLYYILLIYWCVYVDMCFVVACISQCLRFCMSCCLATYLFSFLTALVWALLLVKLHAFFKVYLNPYTPICFCKTEPAILQDNRKNIHYRMWINWDSGSLIFLILSHSIGKNTIKI